MRLNPEYLARFLHMRRVVHKTEGKVLDFNASSILSDYDDAGFIHLSHTSMYSKIGSYTGLIQNFFNTGKFYTTDTKQSAPADTVYYGVGRGCYGNFGFKFIFTQSAIRARYCCAL